MLHYPNKATTFTTTCCQSSEYVLDYGDMNVEMSDRQLLEREVSLWNESLQRKHGAVENTEHIFDLLDRRWFGYSSIDDFNLANNQILQETINCIAPCLSLKNTTDNSPNSDNETRSSTKSKVFQFHGPFSTTSIPQTNTQNTRISMNSSHSSWKTRQWLFPDNSQQQQCQINEEMTFCKSAPRPVPNAQTQAEKVLEGEVNEDKIMEAAWKWRFRRKWGEEQRKAYMQLRDSAPSDEWHMALGRIDDNHNLQFELGFSGTLSTKLTLDSFGSELLGKASTTPADANLSHPFIHGEATHELQALYRKAKTLSEERDRIQMEADRRYNLIRNDIPNWEGFKLDMVQIEQGKDQKIILFEIIDLVAEMSRLVVYGASQTSFLELDLQFRKQVNYAFQDCEQALPEVEPLGCRKLRWGTTGTKIVIVSAECQELKCSKVDQEEAQQWILRLLSQSLPFDSVLEVQH